MLREHGQTIENAVLMFRGLENLKCKGIIVLDFILEHIMNISNVLQKFSRGISTKIDME